jgi:hypothetical protein
MQVSREILTSAWYWTRIMRRNRRNLGGWLWMRLSVAAAGAGDQEWT